MKVLMVREKRAGFDENLYLKSSSQYKLSPKGKGTVDGYEWPCRNQSKDNRHDVVRSDRTTKKVFYAQPTGTRRKGRPNLRWIDDLEKYLLVLRTKHWRTLAGRRLAWKRILEKAKARPGLTRGLTFFRVSAADKRWRAYPLDPRTDAVALYSGCTPDKRRAWFLPGCQMTGTLPPLLDPVVVGFLNAIGLMLVAVRGIRMESSCARPKPYLSSKTFLDCPLPVSPHKSLNSSQGFISEPDLLCTTEAKVLEGFADQDVVQVRRIT
ncbi:uncharacterized protein TNCV_2943221 [Trichonephila clavipes]|nr:uncharacterized protein TNCV_2943221 [Trichonephila clavipes]